MSACVVRNDSCGDDSHKALTGHYMRGCKEDAKTKLQFIDFIFDKFLEADTAQEDTARLGTYSSLWIQEEPRVEKEPRQAGEEVRDPKRQVLDMLPYVGN